MQIIEGDCIEQMRLMQDNSVDSIVTDPPYELGFMGKSWDATGIAFNVEVWQECLRVLKPGGHLLAFSGSRTYHRMAVAIEDAGFEIRDQIMWIYGSGFPKSHNVANAIDKYNGAGNRGHAISSGNKYHPTTGEARANGELLPKYEARTEAGKGWEGWGTALKPAHEPIVVARKPLIGTVAANVLTYGTGGLNIDGGRVGSEDTRSPASKTALGLINDDSWEPKEVMAGSASGRWPANVIHDGSDEVVELFPSNVKGGTWNRTQGARHFNNDGEETNYVSAGSDTSVGSAARFFYCAKASKRDRNEGLEGFEIKEVRGGGGRVSEGYDESTQHLKEAARKYGAVKTAKANTHPTVKPTDLMRYLCRLITPPNGTVLDPFMGSGSTGKAAIYEGFDFIGIEQSADYIEIAKARIAFAQKEKEQQLL